MSVEEKGWRAEEDARTLAEARVIVKDAERLTAARAAAQRMADAQAEKAKALRTVANSKGLPKPEGTGSTTGRDTDTGQDKAISQNIHNVFAKLR
ncbi:hypothetical protein LCGC14_0790860 [marine sediment metagenome]|uniref:Uncharacterized protein n=1 Tax=marine sediment metagenome TaxID=412755 RepID=A0A0F9PWW1_9ZZZZ